MHLRRIEASKANGADAAHHALKAATLGLHALQEALKLKHRYTDLIYNITVAMWPALRMLMHPGSFQHAVGPLDLCVKALAETNDPDAMWRVRLLLALARANEDKGDIEKAVTALTDAIALAKVVCCG